MNPRRGPVESPLVTIAITKLIAGVLEKNNFIGSIFTSFAGGSELNKAIVKDRRIPLVSLKGNSQVYDCVCLLILAFKRYLIMHFFFWNIKPQACFLMMT